MISWRYHLVSIVAVIVALALGVLAGSTVVGDRFVKELKSKTDQAEQRAAGYRAEAGRLQTFMGDAIPWLTADRLAGRQVVLVTQDPVDGKLVNQAVESLRASGAQVVGQVTATTRIAKQDAQPDLATILNLPGADAVALMHELAVTVADRLAFGNPSRGDGHDVFDELKGFVRIELSGVGLPDVGGSGTAIVVLAGGNGQPALDPQAFLVPMVERLADVQSVTTGAGEGLSSTWAFVAAVRGDGAIRDGTIVTVDDLDEPYGGAALVMGLDMLSQGTGGDYGVSGNDGFIPRFVAPSPSP